MHAMKLRVQALRPALTIGARGALPLAGGDNVGVSLRERRATMQVMIGVSLRARWDATLVNIIEIEVNTCKWSSSSSGMFSTAVLVCSFKQSIPTSYPQKIVHGSMTREHEYRADLQLS